MENPSRKDTGNKPEPKHPKIPRWIWLVLGFLFLMSFFSSGSKVGEPTENIDFEQMIENGMVIKAAREFRPGADGYRIYFQIEKEGKKYSGNTTVTKSRWDKYEKLFDEYRVHYTLTETSTMSKIIISLLPILLIFVAIIFLLGRQLKKQGNMFGGMTKAPMTIFEKGECKTKFNDVAGCDEAKAEVQEIVEFLKNPGKFNKLGGKMPTGCLLVGYPGCGKTLLAKAVAGEADVPFLSISGSEFVQMFVGVGAGRIRNLFETARKKAPCIIFIDEIDALSKRGQTVVSNGHDEAGQTMNQLLKELDGFEENPGIVLLAATNQPDKVDEALLRPGRFDRQITVSKPDVVGREAILKVHIRNKKISPNVNLKTIAKMTPGFTGADLANLANEAAILAAKRNKNSVEQDDIESSLDRVTMGHEQKGKIITEEEKNIIAYHEAGHALVGQLLFGDVHKVSIIPRGIGALGYTLQLPEEEKYLLSESGIKNIITVLLAGRKVEEIRLKEITSGAGNDIEQATELAYSFVCRFGMDPKLGPQSFLKQSKSFLGPQLMRSHEYSEDTARQIDESVKNLIKDNNEKAELMINENMDIVEELAGQLKEKETLVREEIVEITKNAKAPSKINNN